MRTGCEVRRLVLNALSALSAQRAQIRARESFLKWPEVAIRHRGHPDSLIRKIVYENPLKFLGQSRNFDFTPPEVPAGAEA